MPTRLGPAFNWLRRRVGFGKGWLARGESVGTSPALATAVLGWRAWLVELAVGGRANVSEFVPALTRPSARSSSGHGPAVRLKFTRRPVGWCWRQRVSGQRSRRTVKYRPFNAAQPRGRVAEKSGAAKRCVGVRRLGPLRVFVAPLAAGERVDMGAAAAFSAWPPTLRELVAYLSPVRRFSGGIAPANNGMQLT